MRVVIAHGHIFKNAGTTFDWSLQRNFGDGFLDHRDDKKMRERGASHLLELVREQPGLQALSSHCLCRPLPEADGIHFEPVYLLAQTQNDTQHTAIKKMSHALQRQSLVLTIAYWQLYFHRVQSMTVGYLNPPRLRVYQF